MPQPNHESVPDAVFWLEDSEEYVQIARTAPSSFQMKAVRDKESQFLLKDEKYGRFFFS